MKRSIRLWAAVLAAALAAALAVMGCEHPDQVTENDTVTSVTVSPKTADVPKGGTCQFSAVVTGTGSGDHSGVIWIIQGDKASDTSISGAGLLSVAEDETAATLTVRAASTVDPDKYDEATVTVKASVAITGFTVEDLIAGTPENAADAYPNAAAVIAYLTEHHSTVTATVAGGSTVSVPVTEWADTDEYDASEEGTYTFTGTLGTLPTGYTYSGTTVTIEVIVSGKPVLAGTVSISGTAKVGEQLTADTSGLVWETSGQLFYQWKAGGVDVAANGTSAAYTVAADDWGKTITVTVSAEHNAGSKTSAPTTAVTGADLAGEVTITGTAKVGEELTAVTSGLTYDPSGQLFYQWTADGSDVGENDASYTVTLADYGKKLKVTVSASKNTGSVSSEETAPAAAAAIPAFGLTGMVTAPEKFQSPVSDFAATDQYTGAIAWKEEDGDDHTGEFYPNAVYKAVVTLAAKTGYTFTGVGENSFTYTSASVSNAADSGVVTITFNATANWAASDCDHFWLVGGASPTGLLIGTGDTKTKMGDAGDENPATFSWTGNLYGGDLKIAATRGGENIDWAGKWLMAGTDGARPTGSAENAVFTMDPTEDNAGADKKWKILQEGTWTITLNTGTGQVTFTKPEAITAGGAWLYGNAAPDGLDWNIAKASAMTGSEGTFTWTGMLCNGQFKILVNTDTTTPSGYVTNYIQFQALVDNTGTTGSAQDAVYVPADSSTDKKWLIWEDTTSHGLGIYTITLDTANNTITTVKVTGANDYKIWLIGDAVGGYDLNTNSKAMTTSDGVTFTYSLTVTDASKTWKFICGKTGSLTFDNPFITADSAEDVTLSGTGAAVTYNGRGSGDDKKFKVGSTGTYTVTLDLAALTATVTTP